MRRLWRWLDETPGSMALIAGITSIASAVDSMRDDDYLAAAIAVLIGGLCVDHALRRMRRR